MADRICNRIDKINGERYWQLFLSPAMLQILVIVYVVWFLSMEIDNFLNYLIKKSDGITASKENKIIALHSIRAHTYIYKQHMY